MIPRPVLNAVENIAKALTDGGGLGLRSRPAPVRAYPHITAAYSDWHWQTPCATEGEGRNCLYRD